MHPWKQNPEGRPDKTGVLLANELAKLDIPVKLLIDSAVAYSMDEVDMVFVGADGVVESGGIINMMGTYQIALVAQSMNKPVYVAAESYKVTSHNFKVFKVVAEIINDSSSSFLFSCKRSLHVSTHWIKRT